MTWQALDTWIVITGALCAVACALPGAVLVLRRLSMMGDAISHTVLPGLAIAFLITQSRDPLPMLVGAVTVGVLAAALVQLVHTAGRLESGAAMGIVFTTMFALGIVLIQQVAADHVDLDPDCVLYGAIETAYLDQVHFIAWNVPRAALINGAAMIVNVTLIVLFYKEFKISAFDPALATTLGINANAMHYLLMTMTAVTAVAAFETVGSILVIAMLIVPGATAFLLTPRFGTMLVLSGVIAAASAALGHLMAIVVPPWVGAQGMSTAGAIAVASGLLFALAWLLSPREGMVSRLLGRLRLALRMLEEDALGQLYRVEETPGAVLPAAALRARLSGPAPLRALALRRLEWKGSVRCAPEGCVLTERGRRRAARVIRTHRLWESFLHRHLPVPPDHLHAPAERLEHVTDPTLERRLAEATDRPAHDPHGRPVPDAAPED